MIDFDELRATLALPCIPGLRKTRARELLQHYNTALNIWEKIPAKEDLPEATKPELIKRFQDSTHLERAELALKLAEDSGDKIIHWRDADYPALLSHCPDAPLVIFTQGKEVLNNGPVIAVVGTREHTAYGEDFLREFVKDLLPYKPLIVSGFARGIDIQAHLTAIDCGLDTVACLGHGFEKVYPAAHRAYLQRLKQQGCLLTEYHRGAFVGPMNFVSRNRIIAGMSEVTVVIESADSGGSLITASLANSYNREVMALPGRYNDPKSKGCNGLIRQNKAAMLNSANDLVKLMGWDVNEGPVKSQAKLSMTDPRHQRLATLMQGRSRTHIDEMVVHTSLDVGQIMVILLEMEMQGHIRALPNRYFCLN